MQLAYQTRWNWPEFRCGTNSINKGVAFASLMSEFDLLILAYEKQLYWE